MTRFDEYRVTLFKHKMREILSLMERVRFCRSKDRSHLVIEISWRYPRESTEKIGAYIMEQLKANGIEFREVRDKYGIYKNHGYKGWTPPLDCICVPIDQEALPERRRG